MYSLNAPVPAEVGALAADVAREVPAARERRRGERTLVVKRLGTGDRTEYQHRRARIREALRGTAPFEAAVTGVDCFDDPPSGPAPVVYLAVESPGLVDIHQRLCEVVEPIEGLEGAGYVPHVTVARGGDESAVRTLADREVDPHSWVVDELVFWDAERSLPAGRVSLPA